MDITSKAELIERLREVWRDGEELRLAILIVELIEQHPDIAHIPYSKFESLAKSQHLRDPHVVEKVIQYLTGAESHVLDLGAELIGDDDTPYRLDADELDLAVTEKIHPFTGEVDATLQSKIFVYFLPSPLARKLLERPTRG